MSDSLAQNSCPTVKLTGPSASVKAGSKVRFIAKVEGGDSKVTPIYEWNVSASGTEISARRRFLEIDTTGITAATLTATLTIIVENKKCRASSSFTVYFDNSEDNGLVAAFIETGTGTFALGEFI